MTDTPLPFDKKIDEILALHMPIHRDHANDAAAIKAALLAAHQAEMRRVIGEAKPEHKDQLGQSPLEDESRCRFYRYGGYNFAVDEYERNLRKRAGIEPEEK